MKVQWSGRANPLFAECAEVLDVPTDQVMGAMELHGIVTVMFNVEPFDANSPAAFDVPLWAAVLRRGLDGVLSVSERHTTGRTFRTLAEEMGLPVPSEPSEGDA